MQKIYIRYRHLDTPLNTTSAEQEAIQRFGDDRDEVQGFYFSNRVAGNHIISNTDLNVIHFSDKKAISFIHLFGDIVKKLKKLSAEFEILPDDQIIFTKTETESSYNSQIIGITRILSKIERQSLEYGTILEVFHKHKHIDLASIFQKSKSDQKDEVTYFLALGKDEVVARLYNESKIEATETEVYNYTTKKWMFLPRNTTGKTTLAYCYNEQGYFTKKEIFELDLFYKVIYPPKIKFTFIPIPEGFDITKLIKYDAETETWAQTNEDRIDETYHKITGKKTSKEIVPAQLGTNEVREKPEIRKKFEKLGKSSAIQNLLLENNEIESLSKIDFNLLLIITVYALTDSSQDVRDNVSSILGYDTGLSETAFKNKVKTDFLKIIAPISKVSDLSKIVYENGIKVCKSF